MSDILGDLFAFLSAVFWRWQSWAGGSGAGGSVVVIVGLYERLTGHSLSKQMYAGIFIVAFLFAAFFVAWRDQYHQVRTLKAQLEDTEPRLIGKIDQVIVGATGETQHAFLVILGNVKNLGYPSTIDSWSVDLRFDGLRTVSGRVVVLPAKPTLEVKHVGTNRSVLLKTSDYLPYRKTNQIPKNSAATGFIMAGFSGVTENEILSQKPTVIVKFTDVRDKAYEMERRIDSTPDDAIGLDDFKFR